MSACGGGGGGSTPAKSTPTEEPMNGGNEPATPILEITTPDGRKIKLDGADLVPEESAGNGAAGSSTARISLGKITSNKNDTTDTTYEIDESDTAGTQNEHFVIIGGALLYMGPAVDFETASVADRMFTLKINRYDNADDAANGRNAQPITAVIDLINGKDLPDAPSGLFLRPADDETSKVYSGGDSTIIENGEPTRNLNTLDYGVLAAGADGSTNPVAVGILAHDTQTDGYLDTTKDGDGDGDDIFISYHYTLAVGAGAGYSNNLFTIDDENQLSFIGADSDVSPTYLIGIATTIRVTIELPALTGGVKGYYDVDASGDITDSDTREFSFSGGALSKTDVGTGDTAHRTIDVTAGKIYASDPANAAGKIISFAADTLRLPATPDIYQYHIIVDGTGEVSAVADLPTVTEFYVLGTTEAFMVPESITFPEIKFTDKDGGLASHDIKIKFVFKLDGNPEISVIDSDGDGHKETINIRAKTTTFYNKLLEDLGNNGDVTALVDVEEGSDYFATRVIINGGIGRLTLSGGEGDETTGTKAQINIGGLIIEAATAGTEGNKISVVPRESGVADSNVAVSGTALLITAEYGNDATLADLITAINADTDTNGALDFVGTAGTDYDPNTLLIDVFFALHSFTDESIYTLKISTEAPIANAGTPQTNTEQTGVFEWQKVETLNPEDFTIKLTPSAEESLPSAAEATPEAEAEAAKPSIGRRILDYLFGSQEEHRQMQNQQIDNMFGDSDLNPINPQDPDIL